MFCELNDIWLVKTNISVVTEHIKEEVCVACSNQFRNNYLAKNFEKYMNKQEITKFLPKDKLLKYPVIKN